MSMEQAIEQNASSMEQSVQDGNASIEQQAEDGKLGLFVQEEEQKDGVQGQKEGQEEKGRQEGQVEDSPRLSQAMEELARRDREVFQKTKALKERETQLSQYQQLAELSKKDPDQVLKAFGIDPAEYVYQKYLAGDEEKQKEVRDPDPEVQTLKQQVQQMLAEKNQQVYQQQYGQGVDALRYTAEKQAEELPLANLALSSQGGTKLADQMLEAASMRYREYGQVPSVQDLVSNVEPLLLDQALGVIRDLWSVEKYREQVMEIIGDKAPKPKASAPPPRSATLSGKMSGEKAAPTARPMSEDERDEEFMRLMRKEGWKQEDED